MDELITILGMLGISLCVIYVLALSGEPNSFWLMCNVLRLC